MAGARVHSKLTALGVSKQTKPGMYGDGGGLWLQVTPSGAKSWLFRFQSPISGKRREMGLGPVASCPLSEARDRARDARKSVAAGHDPVEERKAQRQRAKVDSAKAMTFAECATAYIEAHRAGWKNAKHASQWQNTLTTYAGKTIGGLPVSAVDMSLVLKVLEPIWTTKTETASRLRGRIEQVLDWATVRGYRTGDNPARWKGLLDKVLPAPSKVQKVQHHAALPYQEVCGFMEDLKQRDGFAALGLRFLILTACRSGEVRGARWDEIDLTAGVWTIPAERMKAGKEHRVPLSGPAIALLKAIPRLSGVPLVFPSAKDTPLSDNAFTALLKRMERADLTAHGFRSTFRDWAGETTAFPREVIEHALAHQLKDKAEAAYARGTLFEKRRLLMDGWARHCEVQPATGEVFMFRAGES